MKNCKICRKQQLRRDFDCGKLPVSSHFLTDSTKKEYKHRLSLGQCLSCGTIQLYDFFPWDRLKPKYAWTVRYSEPEAHLDRLATSICNLAGITKSSKIYGLSFKDDTLLSRLRKIGFGHVGRLDRNILELNTKPYGIETIQHIFSKKIAHKVVRLLGKQDIVIVRHILEHVYDPKRFMEAINELLAPNGYLIVEVPGVDKSLEHNYFTTVWEEHIVYFTRFTFQSFFHFFGYPIHSFHEVNYPVENSLLIIARHSGKNTSHTPIVGLPSEMKKFRKFIQTFNFKKKKLHSELLKARSSVLFGAGHVGSMWVNLFKISRFMDCFIDEDKNKIGLFMPGSKLEIHSPQDIHEPVTLCHMTSNPIDDIAIKKNNKKFFSQVLVTKSIYSQ